jgi:hypothetical protein
LSTVSRISPLGAALAVVLLVASAPVSGRPASPAKSLAAPNVASVNLLPQALRTRGSEILAATDDAKRAKLAAGLAKDDPKAAERFLVALLDQDPASVVRQSIVNELGHYSGAATQQALRRHAASDPSVTVSLLALERLREDSMEGLRQILQQRIELAKDGDPNSNATLKLFAEDERWVSLVHGTMLPSFLRQPPGDFAIPVHGDVLRAVAFGDFGDGSESQRLTADAVRKAHATERFDFGLSLGDNFYEEGSESPRDPRWKTQWEDFYGALGIRFYAVLGNHDWKLPDSPAAEILYTSPSWDMPAPYYSFVAGNTQFFAVDTNEVSDLQLDWLRRALEKSTSRWKVVYGHHPIYSAGQHGDTKRLVERLLPVLRDRADVYFCGHDHDMQHLKPDGGVHFFVAGAGGAHQRPIHPHPRTLFARTDVHGFAVIEVAGDRLTVRFIADDGSELYSYTIEKKAT